MDQGRKRRRGFWGWLMGDLPADEGPAPDERLSAEDSLSRAPSDAGQAQPPEVPPGERPCTVCGGTTFRWGWLETGLYGTGRGLQGRTGQGAQTDSGHAPDAAEAPAHQRWVKRKTRFGDYLGLRARLCENCGHVEVFAAKVEQE
jgi:hypothetical protein